MTSLTIIFWQHEGRSWRCGQMTRTSSWSGDCIACRAPGESDIPGPPAWSEGCLGWWICPTRVYLLVGDRQCTPPPQWPAASSAGSWRGWWGTENPQDDTHWNGSDITSSVIITTRRSTYIWVCLTKYSFECWERQKETRLSWKRAGSAAVRS